MPFQPPATDQVVGDMPFVPPETDQVVGEMPAATSTFEDVTETLARGMVRGIPIAGPFLESGIEQAESFLTGKPIEQIEQRGEQLQQERPGLSTGAEIAGSVAGMAPAVAAAPTLFGAGGGSLFARTVLGSASGAGVGAADIAARGGDPKTGAAFGAAGGAAGVAIRGALGRAFARREATVTAQELRAQAGPLFERARAAGMVIRPEPYRGEITRLAARLADEGIDPILHPRATRALVRLQEAANAPSVSLQDMTTLRRIVGAAAGSTDADERRIAWLAIEQLDEFMQRLGPAEVFSGNPQAVSATLREARQLWTRAARAEIIEEAMERAARSMAGGTVTEGTAIRGQFRRIANNRSLMRRFDREQQAAIRGIVRRDNIAETMKLLGGLRAMVITGAGGFAGGPVGAAAAAGATMGLGLAGRAVSAQSARRAAEGVQTLVTTGRPATHTSRAGRVIGEAVGVSGGLAAGREASGEADR